MQHMLQMHKINNMLAIYYIMIMIITTHSTDSSIEAWVRWGTGIRTNLTVCPSALRDTRTCIATSLNLHRIIIFP